MKNYCLHNFKILPGWNFNWKLNVSININILLNFIYFSKLYNILLLILGYFLPSVELGHNNISRNNK